MQQPLTPMLEQLGCMASQQEIQECDHRLAVVSWLGRRLGVLFSDPTKQLAVSIRHVLIEGGFPRVVLPMGMRWVLDQSKMEAQASCRCCHRHRHCAAGTIPPRGGRRCTSSESHRTAWRAHWGHRASAWQSEAKRLHRGWPALASEVLVRRAQGPQMLSEGGSGVVSKNCGQAALSSRGTGCLSHAVNPASDSPWN